ncbi:hypothetical protein L218DRAFT_474618 [Marasmius fiardii PR-910]|nr:hypothetical protein L218DRAFT_474618 [Marasmius fiardii PR-910]
MLQTDPSFLATIPNLESLLLEKRTRCYQPKDFIQDVGSPAEERKIVIASLNARNVHETS